ncbi:MAG TPA: hypothetical protein VKB49_00760 [Candidatus Sulfotelmatobacter sp.]|nr:hypothetical protein [Candidatus Sulfotelmatobacter sp.]
MGLFEKSEELNFLSRILSTHCPATDPIGMEFLVFEGDPAIRAQLLATRLETVANVYRNISDGAAKAAKIVAAGRG